MNLSVCRSGRGPSSATSVFFSLLITALVCTPAAGVIVRGGDGTGNTTAPTDFPYWDALGKISKPSDSPPTDSDPFTYGGTAVYLGNGYVLTAWHVKALDDPTSVTFGGTTYAIDANSWVHVEDDSGVAGDLATCRISGTFPNIASPVPHSAIASSTKPDDTAVYMMGYGRNRAVDRTYWEDDWTETTEPDDATYEGYKWAAGKSMRWGTNSTVDTVVITSSYGTTSCYRASFDDSGVDECTVAKGDSGGLVWVYSGGGWELIGMNLTYYSYTDQPSETAVFGNLPVFADLSVYRDQIVPEPLTAVLLAAGALTVLRRRRG
jgi:hypothetical protein